MPTRAPETFIREDEQPELFWRSLPSLVSRREGFRRPVIYCRSIKIQGPRLEEPLQVGPTARANRDLGWTWGSVVDV